MISYTYYPIHIHRCMNFTGFVSPLSRYMRLCRHSLISIGYIICHQLWVKSPHVTVQQGTELSSASPTSFHLLRLGGAKDVKFGPLVWHPVVQGGFKKSFRIDRWSFVEMVRWLVGNGESVERVNGSWLLVANGVPQWVQCPLGTLGNYLIQLWMESVRWQQEPMWHFFSSPARSFKSGCCKPQIRLAIQGTTSAAK